MKKEETNENTETDENVETNENEETDVTGSSEPCAIAVVKSTYVKP